MTTQSPKKGSAKKPATKKPAAKKAAPAKASSPITNTPAITIDAAAIGRWCYIIGVILAVVIAVLPSNFTGVLWFIYPMILLGIAAGILHITHEDEKQFFLLSISLVVFQSAFQTLFQTAFTSIPSVGTYVIQIFTTLMFFLASAMVAIIVKNVIRWALPS